MIIIATLNPSFAPVTNDSYIGTRLTAPARIIRSTNAGIAHWLPASRIATVVGISRGLPSHLTPRRSNLHQLTLWRHPDPSTTAPTTGPRLRRPRHSPEM